MITGLYVNHKKQQCGVYEFGREIGNLLTSSKKYKFHYIEADALPELKRAYRTFRPDIILYNYTPITMEWVHPVRRFDVPIVFQFQAVHIGTMHEVHQKVADEATNSIFDFHIGPDPTLILNNPLVYKTGRLLPKEPELVKINEKTPTIGSFGFATPGKGFHKIITLVQSEFDEAIIKLNIPFAEFGDKDGLKAKEIAEQCKSLIYKESIQLQINHNYLNKKDLITFLSQNSINVFLYDDQEDRGISSATDWALSVGVPICVSKSKLFRHLLDCNPSICIDNSSLKEIIRNGVNPIQHLWKEFSADSILCEYERIVGDALAKKNRVTTQKRTAYQFYVKKALRKFGLLNLKIKT